MLPVAKPLPSHQMAQRLQRTFLRVSAIGLVASLVFVGLFPHLAHTPLGWIGMGTAVGAPSLLCLTMRAAKIRLKKETESPVASPDRPKFEPPQPRKVPASKIVCKPIAVDKRKLQYGLAITSVTALFASALGLVCLPHLTHTVTASISMGAAVISPLFLGVLLEKMK